MVMISAMIRILYVLYVGVCRFYSAVGTTQRWYSKPDGLRKFFHWKSHYVSLFSRTTEGLSSYSGSSEDVLGHLDDCNIKHWYSEHRGQRSESGERCNAHRPRDPFAQHILLFWVWVKGNGLYNNSLVMIINILILKWYCGMRRDLILCSVSIP